MSVSLCELTQATMGSVERVEAEAEASPPSKRSRLDDDADDHEKEFGKPKEYVPRPKPRKEDLIMDGEIVWNEIDSDEEDEYDDDMLNKVVYVDKSSYDAIQNAKREEEYYRSQRALKLNYVSSTVPPTDREDIKCRICMTERNHSDAFCPYLDYVPKDAKVGPGGVLVCRCCYTVGGHPDRDDWVACAISSNS